MMLQLIKPSRTILKTRSCINLLNHHVNRNYQNLTKLDKLNNNSNQLVNKLNQFSNQSIYLAKKTNEKSVRKPKEDDYDYDTITTEELSKRDDYFPNRPRDDQPGNKPSREQLEEFHKYLEMNFPKFFTERVNLAYFHEYVSILDYQSGTLKKDFGIQNLVKKISFTRIYFSFFYSHNQMNVLSIAKLPDDGLIKLRWRIVSRGKSFIFVQFWKVKEFINKEYWKDGIITFYLNKNGKVKKIIIEKTEKDEQHSTAKLNTLEKIAKI